jgi:ubiquinone/menaquinone biosynthesis C-methylase UbiE
MSFSTFFSNQARKPSGWFGRMVMSRIFDIGNMRLNSLVYENLAPQAGDHILDIGCGTGKLIHRIASRRDYCKVEGLDFSETMVAIARRKNRIYISKGTVEIHGGDVECLPFQAGRYTKISSVNTIYFWKDPKTFAGSILHLLKPGGLLALGFEDQVQLERLRLDPDVFRTYAIDEVETLLMETGCARAVTTNSIKGRASTFHCTMATR